MLLDFSLAAHKGLLNPTDPTDRPLLDEVAGRWPVRRLAAGEVLWFSDDEADELAYVVEGSLTVEVDRHAIGRIAAGELVGEASAFMPVAARTATVRAERATTVHVTSRAAIARLRAAEDADYDVLLDAALLALADRLRQADERLARLAESAEPRPEPSTPAPRSAPPSEPERKLSLHAARLALRLLPVLAEAKDAELTALAGHLRSHTLHAGEALCTQGDAGDSAFLIGDGRLAVLLNLGSHRALNAGHLSAGAMVGSVALLLGTPRTATVIAETDCWVLEMTRAGHQALRGRLGRLWREMLLTALRAHITSTNSHLRQHEARRALLLDQSVYRADALATLQAHLAWPIREPSRVAAVQAQAEAILGALAPHRRLLPESGPCAETPCPDCHALHRPRVEQAVAAGEPLHLILPAFPGKSPNRRTKVLGTMPDMAEEIALTYLQGVCDDIRAVYPPGARVTLCADGRVFSDLVGVDDELVSAYGRAIEATIERLGLRDLDVFHLEHLFEVTDYDGMRDHLAVHYGEPLAELRERCREGAPAAMLNGIHRFLFEDTLGVDVDKSRNQIRKECRERAYRAIHRSNAFSRLIAECFPRALRLSIHPQPPHAAKIGILLGHAAECWITPWHGVALRTPEGWTLVKRSEAEATGARLVEREGRPSHFVLGVDEAHAISAPAAPPGPDDWRRLYAHWFGAIEDSQAWIDTRLPIWFFADPAADEVIRREFAPWLESMTPAIADAWKAHPHGLLSLVLLYDQVPRNAFRGTARMFAWDREARALAREALDRNLHVDLSAIEAFWLFLPSQHHPALPAQRISVEGVDAQAARCLAGHRRFFGVARDMAARHDDAIRRFGRFPHRNALLGRRSTPAEVDFLQDPKNHF